MICHTIEQCNMRVYMLYPKTALFLSSAACKIKELSIVCDLPALKILNLTL